MYGTGVGRVQRRVGVCDAGKTMEREGSDDEWENKVQSYWILVWSGKL